MLAPLRLPSGERVLRISASLQNAAAVTHQGNIWTWGIDSEHGRLGHARHHSDRRVPNPRQVQLPQYRAQDVVCGGEALLVRVG